MEQQTQLQNDIFDMLMKQEEITWQTILYDLVKNEKMDPWNIDVSLIAKKYIDMLKTLKELDFKLSGKVVLAAAILLRIKSRRLVGRDIDDLDALFASVDEQAQDISFFQEFGDFFSQYQQKNVEEIMKLIPRTPQPRTRKVSIYDLMDALEQAMDVKKRRVERYVNNEPDIVLPKKKIDISQIIIDIYGKIKSFFLQLSGGSNKLLFSQLMPPQPTRADKVYTFIPLLHLDTQRKIDISQKEQFGEIEIELAKPQVTAEPAELKKEPAAVKQEAKQEAKVES